MITSLPLRKLILFLVVHSLILEAFAKRGPPPVVPPVTTDLGVEIRVADKVGDVASIEGWDVKSNVRLWTKQVYRTPIYHRVEEDVQWVFISKLELSASGKSVKVTSETGDTFEVDLAKNTRPEK